MVRVADVASHRQPEQLGAEMVLKSRADDLLAVVEVLGADEADDRVHEQWLERTRHRVGPRLAGLHVHPPVTAAGERAPLPRLEVHHVLPHRATFERQGGVRGLLQDAEIDAEHLVGDFRAGNGLEDKVHGRPRPHHLDRVRHMGEHAALRGDVVAMDEFVDELEELLHHRHRIRRRIDADDRVAAAIEEPLQHRRRDALEVVGRMVGLETRREAPLQSDCVAEGRDDTAL